MNCKPLNIASDLRKMHVSTWKGWTFPIASLKGFFWHFSHRALSSRLACPRIIVTRDQRDRVPVNYEFKSDAPLASLSAASYACNKRGRLIITHRLIKNSYTISCLNRKIKV